MPIARTLSVSLEGLIGTVIDIEADLSSNLPGFAIIGLPDAALGEARERVRAAAANSGCPLPSRKLTINLSPAAVPKRGSAFDLAIALACLATAGTVPARSIADTVHLGELGLDGRLRSTIGVLPAVMAAERVGIRRVMVPLANAHEARLVEGVEVLPVASLRDAAIRHGAELDQVVVEPIRPEIAPEQRDDEVDLREVVGNHEAVRALIVAAAGGHHLLLVGPPGAGKTMLARRLPGLLPDLDHAAALEVTSLRSLSGEPIASGLVTRPPWESPHHTATAAAMIGGGSGRIRPGAAPRASHGVLFLDEAPEFAASVLDTLRQPLESGVVRIHRANAIAHFPANFQLVLAANPCPCGQYGAPESSCVCPPAARRRYLSRLSGPLLDRVDMQLPVRRVSSVHARMAGDDSSTSTESVRMLVSRARSASVLRLVGTPWRLNCDVPGSWLRGPAALLPSTVTSDLDHALERGGITMRGYDRVLRVAWTLADLDDVKQPSREHVGQALFFRRGITS